MSLGCHAPRGGWERFLARVGGLPGIAIQEARSSGLTVLELALQGGGWPEEWGHEVGLR